MSMSILQKLTAAILLWLCRFCKHLCQWSCYGYADSAKIYVNNLVLSILLNLCWQSCFFFSDCKSVFELSGIIIISCLWSFCMLIRDTHHDHTCLEILAFSLFFFVFFSFWSLGLWSSLWPRNICLTAEFAFWALGDHYYCCFSLKFSAWLIREAHHGYICDGFFLIICKLWIIVWQIKARFCMPWSLRLVFVL